MLIATQFSAICRSRFTPETTYPPLADSVPHASILWLEWLAGVPTGRSFGNVCGAPISNDLWTSLGHTAALLGMTIVFVLTVAAGLGLASAARAGGILDLTVRAFSYTAWAVPPFLLALALQSVLISAARRGWHPFPISGWPGACPYGVVGCSDPGGRAGWAHAAEVIQALVVPSVALAVAFIGLHSRYLRSAVLTALSAPYTTTARAKGLPERDVLLRHALRNALGVFANVLLLDFGAVIGASLAVDWVFRLNGLGLLFLGSIGGLGSQSGDGPKFLDPYGVQSLLTVTALLVALASIAAEFAVILLDPRSRPS